MNTSPKRMRGMGMLGWIAVLALASFFLTCLFKLGPVYLDHWTVKSILDEVMASQDLANQSKSEIRSLVQRRFDTNRVEAIKSHDLKIEDARDGRVVDASYEKRVPLIYNIDVVVKFNDVYQLKR